MKFKSEAFSAASGAVGGVVYSHGIGGMQRSARGNKRDRKTPYQQEIRNRFSRLSAAWLRILTQQQRDAWENYGASTFIPDRFGDPRPLTGRAAFIAGNSHRLKVKEPLVQDGPTEPGFTQVGNITVNVRVDIGQILILWDTDALWANTINGAFTLQSTRYMSEGAGKANSEFRHMWEWVEPFGTGSGGTTRTWNAFDQRITLATLGQHAQFRIVASLPDGRISRPKLITDTGTLG